MNDIVWNAYLSAVATRLIEEEIGADLRTAMQRLWLPWTNALSTAAQRARFVASMLATAEEWQRSGFDAAVRAGSSAVDQLARATLVALAMCASFDSGGIACSIRAEDSIQNLQLGGFSAHLMALSAASHPDDRRPWHISQAPAAMFRAESGMTILGVVDASTSELYRVACEDAVPFHASADASQNYHHTGQPFPILTASPLFYQALGKGLSAMRKHLAEALTQMNDDRVAGLSRAILEASTNV